MKHFKAYIKLPIGQQEVQIEADSLANARMLLEAQYGVGKVIYLAERLHN